MRHDQTVCDPDTASLPKGIAFLRSSLLKASRPTPTGDMSRLCALALVAAAQASPIPVAAQVADWRSAPTELRLDHGLDRPDDGYCLDIIGAGSAIRFDMPLAAHNCVPDVHPDRIVALQQDGTIHFPAFDGCATVMGLNDRALPGAGLMIKPCGENTAFVEAWRFQDFEHRDDGRLALAGTDLCVVVGDETHATYNRTHRWRTLFVDNCGEVPMERSAWRVSAPN